MSLLKKKLSNPHETGLAAAAAGCRSCYSSQRHAWCVNRACRRRVALQGKSCCRRQRTRGSRPTKPTQSPQTPRPYRTAFRFCPPLFVLALARGGGGAHSAIRRLKPWGRRARGFSRARRVPSGLAVVEGPPERGSVATRRRSFSRHRRLCEMVRILSCSLALQFPPSSFAWRAFTSLRCLVG